MANAILTLNAGSSSLKFAIFDGTDRTFASVRGEIETLDATPHLIARAADGTVLAERKWPTGATEPFPTDPRYGIPKQPLVLWVLEKAL